MSHDDLVHGRRIGPGRAPHHMPRGAFTLIELLVVISIIALLVALLLPALGQARAHAQRAACLSQIRQIGQGVHIYATNNGGHHPPTYGNAPSADSANWMDVIHETLDLDRFAYRREFVHSNGHRYSGYYYHQGGGTAKNFWRLNTANRNASTLFSCPAWDGDTPHTSDYGVNNYLVNHATGWGSGFALPYYGRNIDHPNVTVGVPEPGRTINVACRGGLNPGGHKRSMYLRSDNNPDVDIPRSADGAEMHHHLNSTTGVFVDGHGEIVNPNPIQPEVSWPSYAPSRFLMIDVDIIIRPEYGSPRRLESGIQ